MAESRAVVESGLSRYLSGVRKYPMLDAGTEVRLVKRWRAKRDPSALDRLVGSHLRLVIKIARGYLGYGVPLEELISEGNLGLMRAIERFDLARGVRLNTYAIWWIRAQLQEYVMRSSSLVRMGTTAAQKRLFFNLRRLAAIHGKAGGGELTPEAVATIARELGVRESEVIEMSQRMRAKDASLNETVDPEGELERQDLLIDDEDSQEKQLIERDERTRRHSILESVLGELTPRERHIVVARHLSDEPTTLNDLSVHYDVSRERVRQIEARALQKLAKAMRNREAALPAEGAEHVLGEVPSSEAARAAA